MFELKGVESLNRAQVCMDTSAIRMSEVSDGADVVAKASAVRCQDKIDEVFAEKDYLEREHLKEALVPKMISRTSGLVVAARAGKCMQNSHFRDYLAEVERP